MSQNARESLSALMDNEGDELELRRILKSLNDEPDAADAWRRYHLMRSMMRREADVDPSVDLSAGIMARLEEEPRPELENRPAARRSLPLARGAGVAAAVSLMVITGVQFYNGASPLGGDGAASQTAAASSLPAAGAMRASQAAPSLVDLPMFQVPGGDSGIMTVGAGSYPSMVSPSFQSSQSIRVDQQQARLLQSYLDRHVKGAVSSGGDIWMPLLRSSGSESMRQR